LPTNAATPSATPLTGAFKVEIESLIFDDSDASGAALGSIDHTSPSFTEFSPVPEPSRLALLTLGAAGVIARRRRKTATA
jgi:hypothetical protein